MYNENKEYPKAMNDFVRYLYIKEKAENTIKVYSNHLIEFFKFYKYSKKIKKDIDMSKIKIDKISNIELNRITIKDIEDFQLYLKDGRKNSPSAINNKLSALESFFKFCVKNNIIKINIMSDIERSKQQKRTTVPTLESEEAKKLLQTIANSNIRYKIRDYAIYTIFLNTGLRCSELCDMTINEIKKLVTEVNITGKGNKVRGIYFNKACINVLSTYIPFREEMLKNIKIDNEIKDILFFSQKGEKMKESNLNKTLKQYVEMAGMNPKDVHIHSLRHSYASIAYDNGMDIYQLKEVLGHADIKTVLIYADMKKDKLKRAMSEFSL